MVGKWSDRARSVVSEWQERAYGELAEDLGLGWNPKKVFDQFSTRQVSKDDYRLSVHRLKDVLGHDYDPGVSWEEIERAWQSYKENFYYVDAPTQYEDASIYSSALANLAILTSAIEQVIPGRLDKIPLIASIPSGQLNASIRSIRGTNEVAILIQQGLSGFLYHFSNIVACAVPTTLIASERPLPSAQYGYPGDGKHIEYATRYLVALIDAYVLKGDPYLLSDPDLRGLSSYNQGQIGINMRRFPICHELMHLAYGHLGKKASSKDEAWDREFWADESASTIIGGLGEAENRGSMITSIWACNVTLAGFQFIEQWVSYLRTGSTDTQGSETHPSPFERRHRVFQYQFETLTRDGLHKYAQSLSDVFNAGETILENLWNRTQPYLLEIRRAGIKPSPIWRARGVPET
jgi:hypothetical protein